ncbi:MAG: chromosomal replication initiator protein DnaA [Patescibacteria group bacterium]|jgi:chromosomal replication initiator protein
MQTKITAESLWDQVLPLLRERVGQATVDAVLRGASPAQYDGSTFVLSVPNDFIRRMLEERHRPLIRACLEEVAHQPVALRIDVVDGSRPPMKIFERPITAPAQPPRPAAHEILETTPLNDRYTFDNFVVADCNRFAHAAAQQVCRNPGRSYNPLFIHSKAGLGKTHLMQAIGHQIREQHRGVEVVYISAENFVNQLISAIRDNRTAEFRRRYRYVDVWLVDDIQFIAAIDGPASEEEFFHTFNTLCINDKQVVIASDAPPRQLQIMNDRLRSRLEMGILADLRVPDVETRVAILEKKAEAEQVYIPRDILEYLAKKIESNIRVLEGAFLKLCADLSLNKRTLTIPLIDELVGDYSTCIDSRQVSMNEIVSSVSERFNCSVKDLTGPKRSKDIAWPRQVAVYLARELTDHSLSDIGNFFGGRDHSTILYAYNKVVELVGEDEKTLWLMNDMKAQIRNH